MPGWHTGFSQGFEAVCRIRRYGAALTLTLSLTLSRRERGLLKFPSGRLALIRINYGAPCKACSGVSFIPLQQGVSFARLQQRASSADRTSPLIQWGPAATGIHRCCAQPASSELLVVGMGAKIPVDENESVSATMPSFLDKAVGEICIDALGPALFMRGQFCFGAGSGMQHISPPEYDGVPLAPASGLVNSNSE